MIPLHLKAGLLAAVLLLYLLLSAAAEPPRVRFVFPRRVISAQEGIQWTVIVERHQEHRRLEVAAWDGDLVVRASEVGLEGERARRVHAFRWGPLPAGELEIVASVYSQTERVGYAEAPLTVVGMTWP